MSRSEADVIDDPRLTRASQWFIRLREADIAEGDINDWLQWCDEHPANAEAYRQIQELWSLAGDSGVSEWPASQNVEMDEYHGEMPITTWQQKLGTRGGARKFGFLSYKTQDARSEFQTSRFVRVAIAASLLLAIGAAMFVIDRAGPIDSGVYATHRGATRDLRLADGTIVTLGGASAIRVSYSDNHRDIQLQSGEAYFKVKRDKTRPFVVQVEGMRVTAIGTAFTVRADHRRAIVSVTEGVVEVARPKTAAAQSPAGLSVQAPKDVRLRARAGEQVTYDAQAGVALRQLNGTAVALGWREGALSEIDEPLASVVARVNRYSNQKVILADPELENIRFTGTVLEHQIGEWVTGLERVFPIRAFTRTDGNIELHHLSSAETF